MGLNEGNEGGGGEAGYWRKALETRLTMLSSDCRDGTSPGSDHCVWDDEIKYLEAILVEARFRRNQRCRIVTLPPELLTCIFDLVRPGVDFEGNEDFGDQIVFTHVCRRWRSVALDSPSLWTTISLRNTKWREVMVRRAKRAPCHFFGAIYDYPTSNYTEFISQNLPNASGLELRGEHDYAEVLASLIGTHAPELLVLSITDDDWFEGTGYSGALVPLISNSASTLRTVELSAFQFPWTVGFPNLRTLTLNAPNFTDEDDQYDMADGSYSLFDILSGLNNTPQLEHLTLNSVMPTSNVNESVFPHLPHLQTLSFYGSFESWYTIWRHISIINIEKISISLSTAYTTPYSRFHQYTSELSSRLSTPEWPNFSHMLILEDSRELNFFLTTTVHRDLLRAKRDMITNDCMAPQILYRIPFEVYDGELSDLIHELATVSQHQLESFAFISKSSLFPQSVFSQFQEVLGGWKRLKRLEVPYILIPELDLFLESLAKTENAILPDLRSLTFYAVHFEARQDMYACAVGWLLVTALRQRQQAKLGIRNLVFLKCTLQDEVLHILQELVPAMTWRNCRATSTQGDRKGSPLTDNLGVGCLDCSVYPYECPRH